MTIDKGGQKLTKGYYIRLIDWIYRKILQMHQIRFKVELNLLLSIRFPQAREIKSYTPLKELSSQKLVQKSILKEKMVIIIDKRKGNLILTILPKSPKISLLKILLTSIIVVLTMRTLINIT